MYKMLSNIISLIIISSNRILSFTYNKHTVLLHAQTSWRKANAQGTNTQKHTCKHMKIHRECSSFERTSHSLICQWSNHNICTVNQSRFSLVYLTPCSSWFRGKPCLICTTEKNTKLTVSCLSHWWKCRIYNQLITLFFLFLHGWFGS